MGTGDDSLLEHKSKRKQEFLALVANRMFEKTVHYLDYRACTIVKD